jgi:HAD superfamily phosphoserine phosphatase-like hydrolase
MPPRVLVTDFDGTLTESDFYKVFRERYPGSDAADFWAEYRAGRLSHFEALRNIFAACAPGEPALLELTRAMKLEPELSVCLGRLTEAGWEVIVVSAGCHWYIDRMLAGAGVTLPSHANAGQIVDGRLLMERPTDSPFYSHEHGIDKAAVVRNLQVAGRTVAFAGDGIPDLEPALLVPPEFRFARGDLAEVLGSRREHFRPFERWRDVARTLLEPAATAVGVSPPER